MSKYKNLIAGLFCMLFLFVFQDLAAQTTPQINVSLSNSTLKELIRSIEQQTEYTFIYDNTVTLEKSISVTAVHESLQNVLTKAFAGKAITYEISGKQIILKQKGTPTIIPSGHITGKVLDKLGEPMIGVTVMILGTTIGTITDMDGEFLDSCQ